MPVEQTFPEYVPDGVPVENVVDTGTGYVADFFIPESERRIPSAVVFEAGQTVEFVIRLPTLPKATWSKADVQDVIESVAESVGVPAAKSEITPGLRREPRRSAVDESVNWHPHLEINTPLTEKEAGEIVTRLSNRDRLIEVSEPTATTPKQ